MGPYSSLEKHLLHRLAESTGRAVDLAYASVVHQLGLTTRFFADGGFGDLRVVDFHRDVETLNQWPPPQFKHIKIDWRRVREGKHAGASYSVFRGSFPTPVSARAYDALPPESRTAHAMWIAPHASAPGSPVVVHLAATGDHGFGRREHLAIPLVAQGVGSIALESPFYGMRKPPEQQGAKLRRVSDLLLLGRATIEESLFLLSWLSGRGHSRLGVAGLSMGGVHAAMVASLYPDPVALTPLLAPRSAAASYCTGALFHATAWDRLLRDTRGREAEIVAAVEAAAAATERVAAARVKKQEAGGTAEVRTQSEKEEEKENVKEGQAAQGKWMASTRWVSEWSSSLGNQLGKVRRLQADKGRDAEESHAAAVALLEIVLETFTDATRFPVPRRPDAAVLVAATEDAYVSGESVIEMHRHLPGSEIRWVPGGHVSSFLLHQPTFRRAIVDSIDRL